MKEINLYFVFVPMVCFSLSKLDVPVYGSYGSLLYIFQASAGTLHFQDGQSYAEFSIELVDDQMSELEKFFFVELSAPTGGGMINSVKIEILEISIKII